MNDTTTINQTTGIPAIDCPLSGAYLIEASAGTGKTWTLTGIMLRLLIEKNMAPERIVATTFTRAAATEMKERLYERLNDFYEVCLWLKKYEGELFFAKDKIDYLNNHKSPCSKLDDQINYYLVVALILSQSPKELDRILMRAKLLLASVDKLFIGTLDSLAQKWLKEFGNTQKLELLQDPSNEIHTIVHDTLRKLDNELYYNHPMLYQLIDKSIFKNTTEMVKITQNAIHFFISKIDEISLCDLTVLSNEFMRVMDNLCLEAFKPFLIEPEKLHDWGFSKNYFSNHLQELSEVMSVLNHYQEQGMMVFNELTGSQRKLLDSLTKKNVHHAFNKKYDPSAYELWHSLNLDGLVQLNAVYQKFTEINQNFEHYVIYQVAMAIRENLALSLEKNNQTSFTIEMVKLLTLLSGIKGESIAQHIRHLYPVALIDETQDINGEQTQLLFSVYLRPSAKKYLFDSKRGFLLCVGDPKQAIYRFRGGDVTNYNYLKSLGLNTDFSLTINRRSNQKMIAAINHWFDADDKTSIYNTLGENISYATNTAHKTEVSVSWLQDNHKKPIELLHLSYQSKYDKLYLIALHVNTLLQSNQTIQDKESNQWRALMPSDIAILLARNEDIDIIQSHLKKLNIDSVSASEQNVFNSQAAEELLYLIEATIDPKEQKLMAVLTGIYGYTLKKSHEILLDNKKRSQLLIFLKRFLHYWQKHGINTAMTIAFEKPALLNGDFWSYLATFDNSERYLTDLWQIIDIIGTWQLPPTLFLKEFYKNKKSSNNYRLSLPSESGIQLMTIHRSKGLEFGVVYVFDLQKNRNDKSSKLYPYTEHNIRKLSVVAEKDDKKTYYKDLDKQEDLDEKKRLGYVALTRAREQLYVVVQDTKQSSKNAMNEWGFMQDGKLFCVPERLKNDVELIGLDELMDYQQLIDKPYIEQKKIEHQTYFDDWQDIYKKSHFFGMESTSFTNIVLNFNQQNHALVEETIGDDDVVVAETKYSGAIQSRFMRGKKAGTFLHKLLQKIANNQTDKVIFDTSREMSLSFDDKIQQEIENWIMMVANQPFLSSNIALTQIKQKQAEFGFLMGLKDDFNPNHISELFKKYSNHYIADINFDDNYIIGFLKGEIDLLYCYNDKYYVVDYKSNYLADECSLYNNTQMTNAMNEHSYWLQAVIYQVALHRLLKLRIPNYVGNESNYLGAVEYVFLRGIDESNSFGRLVWDIPFALIDELDKLFG